MDVSKRVISHLHYLPSTGKQMQQLFFLINVSFDQSARVVILSICKSKIPSRSISKGKKTFVNEQTKFEMNTLAFLIWPIVISMDMSFSNFFFCFLLIDRGSVPKLKYVGKSLSCLSITYVPGWNKTDLLRVFDVIAANACQQQFYSLSDARDGDAEGFSRVKKMMANAISERIH